jgi:hypothetical protein
MDDSYGNTADNLRPLGETPHRSVRHQAEQQIARVRVTSPRSTSRERRRSHVRLDMTGRLCFSAAGTVKHSTQENTAGELSNNTTSSQLASTSLVHSTVISTDRDSGKTGHETGSPLAAPVKAGSSETGSLQASRLETIQQSLREGGFSENVSSSVARAQRSSTESISRIGASGLIGQSDGRWIPVIHQSLSSATS